MKLQTIITFFSLIVLAGCGAKNPISGKKVNQELNNKRNDYFMIREPDSVFFTKKGQEVLLKTYSNNYIVYENRFENEQRGINDFLKQLEKSLQKNDVVDVLYSRQQPTDAKTFHWNVFTIKKDKTGKVVLISNENDLKAPEMVKLLDSIKQEFLNKKQTFVSIFLPQIQYSHKGCSVKGVVFIKALHKNNNELFNELLKLTSEPAIYGKHNNKGNNYYEIHISDLLGKNKNNTKLDKLVIKRYVKFTQKDAPFESKQLDRKFIEKHQNGTHLKRDKNKKDIWAKTSKLHDKGYKFIYEILLNNKQVAKNVKITKSDILSINDSFKH